MKKYFKLMYDTISYGGRKPYEYEINKLTVHDDFDENSEHHFGGFFVAEKPIILRFLTWGTTLYEVVVPSDAKVIEIANPTLKTGIYKVDKMTLTNPIKLNDDLVLKLFQETKVPDIVWFEICSLCALHGFEKSATEIIKLYVNEGNIAEAIERYTKYYNFRNGFMFGYVQANIKCAEKIYQLLCNFNQQQEKN